MKIKISKSVVSQSIDQEKVVLNLETNKYHSLNQYGLIIWDLIDKEKNITFKTLIEEIKQNYRIEDKTIIDIKEYIYNLQSLNLINIEDE